MIFGRTGVPKKNLISKYKLIYIYWATTFPGFVKLGDKKEKFVFPPLMG